MLVPYAYGWEPCVVPCKEGAGDVIMIDEDSSHNDSSDDNLEFLDITDNDERDFDYIPSQDTIEGGES